MNKNEIIAALPDFVRGRLSPEDTAHAAVMIAADPALARECEELRKYFASISSLPREKAPTGFAARVMRRIDHPETKQSLAARIFLPLHIKIPLEAAALLATVALLIVIYHPFQKITVPLKEKRMTDVMALSEQSSQPAIPSAPSPAADQSQSAQPPATNYLKKSRVNEPKRDDISFEEEKMVAKSAPAKAITTEQSSNIAEADLAIARTPAGNAGAGGAAQTQETEFTAKAPVMRSAATAASSPVVSAATPAAASAGTIADMKTAAKPAFEAEQETPVQWELTLAEAGQSVKRMRRRDELRNLQESAKIEVAPAEDEKFKPSPSIELAIRSAGGEIIRTEPDTAHAGATRYIVTVRSSSCDKLIATLSKHGNFTPQPKCPVSRPDSRVMVVLLVR